MESTNLSKKPETIWVFRKIHLKNIDSFPKIFRMIFLKSEKEGSQQKDCTNLKFTKFSIFFKATQKKRRSFLKSKNLGLLLLQRSNPSKFPKLKKCKIFSIYENNVILRINLKKLFPKNIKYFGQNTKFNLLCKKKKEKKLAQKFSVKCFLLFLEFKRINLFFSKSSKNRKIERNRNFKFEYFYNKEFKKGISIFFKTINRITKEVKIIFSFFLSFLIEMTVSKSNLFKTFSNNFYHLMCKNLASQRYTSLEFFLKSVSFKCKRANLEKNLKKRNLRNESQLRFFSRNIEVNSPCQSRQEKIF